MCGFEAFINGKHIVGEVKEKEQAHKEYREAISQGHGAYLMDEETPVGVCIINYLYIATLNKPYGNHSIDSKLFSWYHNTLKVFLQYYHEIQHHDDIVIFLLNKALFSPFRSYKIE